MMSIRTNLKDLYDDLDTAEQRMVLEMMYGKNETINKSCHKLNIQLSNEKLGNNKRMNIGVSTTSSKSSSSATINSKEKRSPVSSSTKPSSTARRRSSSAQPSTISIPGNIVGNTSKGVALVEGKDVEQQELDVDFHQCPIIDNIDSFTNEDDDPSPGDGGIDDGQQGYSQKAPSNQSSVTKTFLDTVPRQETPAVVLSGSASSSSQPRSEHESESVLVTGLGLPEEANGAYDSLNFENNKNINRADNCFLECGPNSFDAVFEVDRKQSKNSDTNNGINESYPRQRSLSHDALDIGATTSIGTPAVQTNKIAANIIEEEVDDDVSIDLDDFPCEDSEQITSFQLASTARLVDTYCKNTSSDGCDIGVDCESFSMSNMNLSYVEEPTEIFSSSLGKDDTSSKAYKRNRRPHNCRIERYLKTLEASFDNDKSTALLTLKYLMTCVNEKSLTNEKKHEYYRSKVFSNDGMPILIKYLQLRGDSIQDFRMLCLTVSILKCLAQNDTILRSYLAQHMVVTHILSCMTRDASKVSSGRLTKEYEKLFEDYVLTLLFMTQDCKEACSQFIYSVMGISQILQTMNSKEFNSTLQANAIGIFTNIMQDQENMDSIMEGDPSRMKNLVRRLVQTMKRFRSNENIQGSALTLMQRIIVAYRSKAALKQNSEIKQDEIVASDPGLVTLATGDNLTKDVSPAAAVGGTDSDVMYYIIKKVNLTAVLLNMMEEHTRHVPLINQCLVTLYQLCCSSSSFESVGENGESTRNVVAKAQAARTRSSSYTEQMETSTTRMSVCSSSESTNASLSVGNDHSSVCSSINNSSVVTSDERNKNMAREMVARTLYLTFLVKLIKRHTSQIQLQREGFKLLRCLQYLPSQCFTPPMPNSVWNDPICRNILVRANLYGKVHRGRLTGGDAYRSTNATASKIQGTNSTTAATSTSSPTKGHKSFKALSSKKTSSSEKVKMSLSVSLGGRLGLVKKNTTRSSQA